MSLQIPKREQLVRTTIFPPEMVRICQNAHNTTNYTMFSFLQTQMLGRNAREHILIITRMKPISHTHSSTTTILHWRNT